jgi:hypothetical protein
MARKKTKTATRSRSGSRSSGRGGGRRGSAKPAETAHAKRIRLYLERHPGATKAQARGHKPAEHKTRKERAQKLGKLTENERATIKRFALRQSKRDRGGSVEDNYRVLMMVANDHGMTGIRDIMQAQKKLEKSGANYIYVTKKKGGVATLSGDLGANARNLDLMDAIMARYDLPDTSLLYYH